MMFIRNFLALIVFSFFFLACSESASSKINPDNKSNIENKSSYAEGFFKFTRTDIFYMRHLSENLFRLQWVLLFMNFYR